jgi:protein-tyrosine phosphatase
VAAWTDLHSHVLPGVDDGPARLDESLDLVRALAAEGISTVCATPHVQPHPYPTTVAQRDDALARLREAVARAGVEMEIVAGGEVDLEYAATWNDDELRPWLLGERTLLLEFPWTGVWPMALAPTCVELVRRGYLPVVAHPERIRAVQAAPGRLDELVEIGAVVQVTAGSLTGSFGRTARDTAIELFRRERAHLVASDAHDRVGRGAVHRAAHAVLSSAAGEELADAAFGAVPAAVLEGQRPTLPAPRGPRRLGRFRR